MRAAVKDAVAFQRALAVEEDGESRRAIEAQDCEIVELTAAEHGLFADAVRPLLDEAKTTYGREMFGMVGGR
jgi:TRAP-type C4-dicarboxylate transport system substrate-binding protein